MSRHFSSISMNPPWIDRRDVCADARIFGDRFRVRRFLLRAWHPSALIRSQNKNRRVKPFEKWRDCMRCALFGLVSACDSRAELVTPTSYLLLTSPVEPTKIFFSYGRVRKRETRSNLIDRNTLVQYIFMLLMLILH